jgi:hypothetical protein
MVMAFSIAGCASTSTKTYRAAGTTTICNGNDNGLGYIVILPETAWRNDQKEPAKRETMALAGCLKTDLWDVYRFSDRFFKLNLVSDFGFRAL